MTAGMKKDSRWTVPHVQRPRVANRIAINRHFDGDVPGWIHWLVARLHDRHGVGRKEQNCNPGKAKSLHSELLTPHDCV